MSVQDDPEWRALRAYSAQVGRDSALVQAAGGNTSLKHDGVLWIKASGTWLAEAESREIMIPVGLGPILAALDDGDRAEHASAFMRRDLAAADLRPSIETSLHAVLPHRVVVHVHCVETLAWAVREDAERALREPLAGLAWCFVPYVRPGPPLARLMRTRLAAGTDVVVLGNHGLVVGGGDTAAVAGLIAEVQRRLRRPCRAVPDVPDRPAPPGYRRAEDPATHATALDRHRLAVARSGSLYPDHVIFLGPGVAEQPGRPLLLQPGHGAYLQDSAPEAAAALARCLADVTGRIDPEQRLTVLSPDEEAALLNWDAEQYRKLLSRSPAG